MRRLIAVALTVLVVATVEGSSRQSSEGIAPLKPTSTSLSVSVTEFTLANGLHVILHRDTSVPVVAVNVWYHVGSANEKPGRTGFAHLFEHLMFEGSKNVPEGRSTAGSKRPAAATTARRRTTGRTTTSTSRRTRSSSRCSSSRIAWAICSTR